MEFRVLAIDTAGPVVGVALWQGSHETGAGRIQATWSARVVRGAERRLVPALSDLLRGQDAQVVAVSVGPGAFTGLRVGIATALGLATSWSCPMVAVTSLEARAALAWGHPRVLALLDARKSKFYAGLFDTRGPEPVALEPEKDAPLEHILLASPAVVVGEGGGVVEARLEAAGMTLLQPLDGNPAPVICTLAARRFLRGETTTPTALRIRYLREPDARIPADLARKA